MPYNFPTETDRHMRTLLFTPCKTREEVKQWVMVYLDLELPDTCVDPESNSNMLDMVYTCYSHIMDGPKDEEASRYLWYSNRFGGKTLCESIIEVMLLLHARIDITHLAALERQSRDCQKYIAKFFNLLYLKGILIGDNKKEKAAVYYVPADRGPNLTEREFKTLPVDEQFNYDRVSNSVEVIVATLASTNGKHTALLCLDEIDVMANKEAFEESKNIPTPGRRPDGSIVEPLTLLTSTRKFAFGIVAREIEKAKETGLIVKTWNILDICRACPKDRHRPDLPKVQRFISEELLSSVAPEVFETLPTKEKEKYQRIECYQGCVSNCKMLPACKTHLATRQTSTSKFLLKIPYVQKQIKVNNLDKALAQLLCRKPSTMGLVYPGLSETKHKILPYQAYEKIFGEKCRESLTRNELVERIRDKGEWFAGIDWGYVHPFAFVMGIKLGKAMYITHVFGESDLEPSQKIDSVEKYRQFDPKVWADTEDPAMIKAFRRAGWRMVNWSKGKVASGISTVRMKLTPTLDQRPELFFVRDIGEDPMMELCFLHLKEHHYKLGVDGQPTDTPSDEDKDFPDATRYLIHNLFDPKGQISIPDEPEVPERLRQVDGNVVYDPKTWLSQKIGEITGEPERPPATTRPQMTIEPIGMGTSYYGEVNNQEADKKRKGKSRGIVFDFG